MPGLLDDPWKESGDRCQTTAEHAYLEGHKEKGSESRLQGGEPSQISASREPLAGHCHDRASLSLIGTLDDRESRRTLEALSLMTISNGEQGRPSSTKIDEWEDPQARPVRPSGISLLLHPVNPGISATSPLLSPGTALTGSPLPPSQDAPSLVSSLSSPGSAPVFPMNRHPWIHLMFEGSEVDLSEETRLQIIYKARQNGREGSHRGLDGDKVTPTGDPVTDAAASSELASPTRPSDRLKERLDALNEESFTLESFSSLIQACFLESKYFILARVRTYSPATPHKIYHSYYDAQHLNKVLFTKQVEKGLLHRMQAKNPLNNMLILGAVEYFYISPIAVEQALAPTLTASEKLPLSELVLPALLFATDEDYLSIVKVRDCFSLNSVKPEEHALLSFEDAFRDRHLPGSPLEGGRVVYQDAGVSRTYEAPPRAVPFIARPQSSVEYVIGLCGHFDHASPITRRKMYLLFFANYFTLALLAFFLVPASLKAVLGIIFILILFILVIIVLENDRVVTIHQLRLRLFREMDA